MNIAKELEVRARKTYLTAMAGIPEKVRYHDAHKHIRKRWVEGGVGRSEHKDMSTTFPRYTFMNMGPMDRAMDVNFFVEDIEERFGLEFISAEVDNDSIIFRYGPHTDFAALLVLFFRLHSKGTCYVVQEETEPTVHKNYKRQLVCNE